MSLTGRVHRTAALVLLFAVATPPFLGADKVKHFLMSFLVQSATYSVGRAAGLGRPASRIAGGAAVLTIGVMKEIHDRSAGKPFSVADLFWDVAGGTAAASLLNGAR